MKDHGFKKYGKEGLWEKMSLKVKPQKRRIIPEKEKLATMIQSSHNGSKQLE